MGSVFVIFVMQCCLAIIFMGKRKLVALLPDVLWPSKNFGSFENQALDMYGVVQCMKKLHFISQNWRKEK